ncbi:hypothetical protein [Streptomyces sp. AcE210]|uniref:hypothetical protein n=1 Tax=Streptomyces sp. AcE210 TaxID=2292703 RepID=UPI00105858A7|nr:hypothetical protein [Streptomyces sp. AcE210]
MDQGVAALLGSALGAGTALVTARATNGLQARKHRREDYIAFLDAAGAFDEAQNRVLRAFVNDRHPEDGPLLEDDIDQLIRSLDAANFGIMATLGRVHLAGPASAAKCAKQLFHRGKMHAEWARSWRREHMSSAVPDSDVGQWQRSLQHFGAEVRQFTDLARRKS